MKVHLIKVWKARGKKPKELEDLKPIPSTLLYVWNWYIEIGSYGRQTYSEIEAWSRLMGVTPTCYEVTLLRKLDETFNKVLNGDPISTSGN